jgi:hypothetical protein
MQNCAANLEVRVIKTNTIYEIFETNTSNVTARCHCNFDTYFEIADIQDRSISLVVAGQTFYLNLDSANGLIIVDTTTSGYCR